jgi:hypothetical protein
LCKNRRLTRDARERFFKNPFKFVRDLFEAPRTGTLSVDKEELQAHLRESYTDIRKDDQLEVNRYIVWPSTPGV